MGEEYDKLDEEVAEFHDSGDAEELADVVALAEADGVSESELADLRRSKADERGRFDDGVVLEAVER